MPRILAADIGGTHSRFALFRALTDVPRSKEASGPEGGPLLALERERRLMSSAYPDFFSVLRTLFQPAEDGSPPLLDARSLPDVAVLAPAGPVQDGVCRMPNLPWVIRIQDARESLGLSSIHMINDFAAQAYACLLPEAVDAIPLLDGLPPPRAPAAIVGAGTGFGQALLLDMPGADELAGLSPASRLEALRRVRVLPSEGGHAEVPFVGPQECAFAAFAAERAGTPRLIGDAVVSCSGLAHLLAFHTGLDLSPYELAAQAPGHPEVMVWFARFYGRLCRNYVLSTLALGGLHVTAGMALRVPVLTHPAFAEEFYASKAQRHLLERVPVRHIRNPLAGLWGAALYGLLRHPT